MRSRYYDTTTGRFTQRDSYLGKYTDPLSLNRYTYCKNNPVMYKDPSGYWAVGDEKYDLATQEKIMAATQDYYRALENGDRTGMAQARTDANTARVNGTTGTQPSGVTPGKIYTEAINNSKNGYMTLADFQAADKEIKDTAPTWSYNYTLEAISVVRELDKNHTTYVTNNLDLLQKWQGPNVDQLFILNNYWFLVNEVQNKKGTSHITGDNLQLKALNPDNQTSLERWYVDSTGNTLTEHNINIMLGLLYPTWGNINTLLRHITDHASDFGIREIQDYVDLAHQFYLDRNLYQIKIDKDGIIRVYDPNTKTFGSYNPDGTSRTLFKPRTGQKYFDKQPGSPPQPPSGPPQPPGGKDDDNSKPNGGGTSSTGVAVSPNPNSQRTDNSTKITKSVATVIIAGGLTSVAGSFAGSTFGVGGMPIWGFGGGGGVLFNMNR